MYSNAGIRTKKKPVCLWIHPTHRIHHNFSVDFGSPALAIVWFAYYILHIFPFWFKFASALEENRIPASIFPCTCTTNTSTILNQLNKRKQNLFLPNDTRATANKKRSQFFHHPVRCEKKWTRAHNVYTHSFTHLNASAHIPLLMLTSYPNRTSPASRATHDSQ